MGLSVTCVHHLCARGGLTMDVDAHMQEGMDILRRDAFSHRELAGAAGARARRIRP